VVLPTFAGGGTYFESLGEALVRLFLSFFEYLDLSHF
jgi:hypothetical protein